MANEIAISDAEVDDIVDKTCDHLAFLVQTELGQTDGGIGGQVFHRGSKAWTSMRCIVVDYLAIEELHQDGGVN